MDTLFGVSYLCRTGIIIVSDLPYYIIIFQKLLCPHIVPILVSVPVSVSVYPSLKV